MAVPTAGEAAMTLESIERAEATLGEIDDAGIYGLGTVTTGTASVVSIAGHDQDEARWAVEFQREGDGVVVATGIVNRRGNWPLSKATR